MEQSSLIDLERKARVDAAWEQMNKGVSIKKPASFSSKPASTGNKVSDKPSSNWMTVLGFTSKKVSSSSELPSKRQSIGLSSTSEEAKRLAAAALSAVKEATSTASINRGKIEITEIRDFAGENVEVKKLVDADSIEASEKENPSTGPQSRIDAVLEQIKKKPKLSVLGKTKKDWGEFKGENKGLEEELDAYKKSSNQYLDKVSFLQRADFREFERERDSRLALQAKRKSSDMREDL